MTLQEAFGHITLHALPIRDHLAVKAHLDEGKTLPDAVKARLNEHATLKGEAEQAKAAADAYGATKAPDTFVHRRLLDAAHTKSEECEAHARGLAWLEALSVVLAAAK